MLSAHKRSTAGKSGIFLDTLQGYSSAQYGAWAFRLLSNIDRAVSCWCGCEVVFGAILGNIFGWLSVRVPGTAISWQETPPPSDFRALTREGALQHHFLQARA